MKKNSRSPLATIFLTVLLDMLGVGIIIPIVAPLLLQTNLLLDAGVSAEDRNLIYGILVATFPLAQFFGAPLMGSLSDKYGRRPVLFASLFITIASYTIFALGISAHNLLLAFIGRFFAGLAAGNLAVVFSAIADTTLPENRAKSFGMVGAAFGVGFVIGPVIGGYLSNSAIVSWFDYATPFWAGALLACINLVSVLLFFPETHTSPNSEATITAFSGFRNLQRAFGNPMLRRTFAVSFLFTFGFSFFTQFFQVFMIEKFDVSAKDIGQIFGYIGILLIITQGGLVRVVGKRTAPLKILLLAMPVMILGYLLLLLPDTIAGIYLVTTMIPVSQGLATPNLAALISTSVPADMQGETMGIQGSVNSLAQMLPPIIGGYVVSLGIQFPFMLAAVCTVLAWIVLANTTRKTAA